MRRINLKHFKVAAINLLVFSFIGLNFQNCNDMKFSTNPSGSNAAASTSNTGGGGTSGGTEDHTAPVCIPTASDTPIITALPAGITSAMVAAICPAIGHDSECGVVIIISDSGMALYFTGQGPYDGNDDTLVGVVNMSSKPVSKLSLSSAQDIMGFDNDGLLKYYITGTTTKVAGNSMDTTGYGGPNAYFSNISSNHTSGTVNFIVPIAAAGGTTFFALENALTSKSACLTTSVQ